MNRLRTLLSAFAWCTLAGLAYPAHAAPAPASKAESALLEAESHRFRAAMDKDIATLQKSLADELTYVHSSGVLQTKAEFIRDIETGATIYHSIEVVEQKPRVYGSLGIINGVVKVLVSIGGAERNLELRYTDAHVKRDGRWQLIAWQSTRTPDPPAK